MKGSVHIKVYSDRLGYDFTITRKITIITGDSGTGKSVMVQMIRDSKDETLDIKNESSAVCVTVNSDDWERELTGIHDSVVFIDEFVTDFTSQEFAAYVSSSSNYFVLITREPLKQLAYSVKEVYNMTIDQKYSKLVRVHNTIEKRYLPNNDTLIKNTDVIITEDESAGHKFFTKLFENNLCVAAGGNSVIPAKINEYKNKRILVIGDGAAFGAHMESCYRKLQYNSKLILYLPESFEYLILKTGLFNKYTPDIPDVPSVQKILVTPQDYIEASEFNSWEKFFTRVLTSVTKNWSPSYKKNCSEDFFDSTIIDKVKEQIFMDDIYLMTRNSNSLTKMSLF